MDRNRRSARLAGPVAASLLFLGAAAPAALAQEDVAVERARQVEGDLMELIERVSEAYVVIGGGSGIIVSPEGDVLTNHHVAGSRPVGEEWQVILPGTQFETAVMVGTDERGDISLLRLQGEGPWPYVPLADSDAVEVGDACVALGNPFGFSKDGTPHVTLGVVSAVHRNQGGYSDAIQTDAPINPGNSGGPLIDMSGRLIGINGRIAVRWGNRANSGVGYAIPTNQIKAFVPHFREKGEVGHGTVRGLNLENSDEGGTGAIVKAVGRRSGAHERGLRAGDVIVEAGGRPVHSVQRFQGILGTYPAGVDVPVVVMRGADRVELELELEPRGGGIQTKGAFLGVRMSNADGRGVEVEAVVPDSAAQDAGVQAGDVVFRIQVGDETSDVENARQFVGILAELEPGTRIVLSIRRGEAEMDLEVTLGKRGE